MLTATLSPDLAHADGHDPKREELILTLALAITVAVALKVVGALLDHRNADHPRRYRPHICSHTGDDGGAGRDDRLGRGLWRNFSVLCMADTPTGPTIVATAAAGLFVVGTAGRENYV